MSDLDELPSIAAVLEDPASSHWLKSSVQTAIQRDPVDALNDALFLTALLDQRLREQLGLDTIY